MRRLLPGESPADWTDSSGGVGLVERDLPPSWAGKKLSGLTVPGVFALAAVTRLGTAQVARPDLVGQDGDILHFMADLDALGELEHTLGHGPDH
jgi:Trk K+ transport system NAD-binding subunit